MYHFGCIIRYYTIYCSRPFLRNFNIITRTFCDLLVNSFFKTKINKAIENSMSVEICQKIKRCINNVGKLTLNIQKVS